MSYKSCFECRSAPHRGASVDLDIPALQVNLLDENDELVVTSSTDILKGKSSVTLANFPMDFINSNFALI